MAILNNISPNGSKALNQQEDYLAMDAVHSKHHRIPAASAIVPVDKHKAKSKFLCYVLDDNS